MNQRGSIILVGGGGHCRSCIDVIEQDGRYNIAGIIDIPEKLGEKVLSYEVLGSDDDLPEIAKKHNNFLITLGYISSPAKRIRIYNLLKSFNVKLPVIISPLAYVSKHAKIGEGSIVMHQAIVNAGAKIGVNCIINSKALIEHDAQIKDNNHISTGAIVNGGCKIESNCLIGSKAILKQSIKIEHSTIIGAGAVVTKNILESGIYVGNPARRIS
jgi:sugar O-acyltransferase (sialic acid O-acetyltransferase NeuD family)